MTTHDALFSHLRQYCRGAANTTPLPTIAQVLGTTTRQVQSLLEECAGIDGAEVVVSSCGKPAGIFITADPSEMQDFLQQLRNRERNTRKRRLAVECKYPQLREVRLGRPPLVSRSYGASLRAQTRLELSL